jgi:glycosyltransferase involved in cell wall biosynthesis
MKGKMLAPELRAKAGLHLAIDATNIRQGGGVTHLSQLLQAADPQQSGIDRVTVWTGEATASVLPERPWLNLRSDPWMEAALAKRMLGQQFVLPRAIAAEGCDVLFSPGGTFPSKRTTPIVTMSQNMLPFEPGEAARFGRFNPMRLKMRMLRYSQGASFKRADGVIFLTQYAQNVVSHSLGALSAAQALIPHGIEQRFLQAPRTQRKMTTCSIEQPFRVLYVSILMPYKHQIEVALAVSQLRSDGLPVEMRFIGAPWGGYGRQFRELLDRLDPKHEYLRWTGAEPFEALHDFYKNADMFIFASSCENLPNIMIEAMASGLPIACSNLGPMPEVLGDAGIYFDPCSPDSITKAVQKIAHDTALRTHMAECAWQKAQKYSWQICAHETFKFIAKVASEARR